MTIIEKAMIEALAMMRFAGMSQYANAPKTAEDQEIQCKVYLHQMEEAWLEVSPVYGKPKLSAGLIRAAANKAISRGGDYPSASDFAQIALRLFRSKFEVLSISVGGEIVPECLPYIVPKGADQDTRDIAKARALASAGLVEALPSRVGELTEGAKAIMDEILEQSN